MNVSIAVKCDRRDCKQPRVVGFYLCLEHYQEQLRWMGDMHRSYARHGAGSPTKVYTCPKCGDQTDNPSNLCNCNPD